MIKDYQESIGAIDLILTPYESCLISIAPLFE